MAKLTHTQGKKAFLACLRRATILKQRIEFMVAEWRDVTGAGHWNDGSLRPMSPVSPDMTPTFQLFMASLWPLVEAWREMGYSHPDVDDRLLNEDYLAMLRQFRNAVWHFNPVDDHRIMALRSSMPLQKWAYSLYAAMSAHGRRLARPK